jgi:UDP-glucuronate decarboxylase
VTFIQNKATLLLETKQMDISRSVPALSVVDTTEDSTCESHSDGALRRILVTGGAGFLGSHLCEFLLEAGHNVICADNFSTGLERNISHLRDFDTFSAISHDIVDSIDLEIDEIYNLACPASPPHYQADPIRTMRTSVLGALNMLDLAHKRSAKIFQASTSEVYGDPDIHPQPESYLGNVNAIGPRACYDEGKRSAETLFFDYQRRHDTRIKVVRIFNTYGPRMRADDGRVVSNFIVQALTGKDITIYGDGSQTRSFCYVDDLIRGFHWMMGSADEITGPINLGNPGEFTVAELASMVIDLTGSRSRIVHMPLPVDDPRQRRPDITRAEKQLGWRPNTALHDGLGRTIAYFNEALSTEGALPVRRVA